MRRGLPLKPPETDEENANCLIKWDVTSHHTPVNVPKNRHYFVLRTGSTSATFFLFIFFIKT